MAQGSSPGTRLRTALEVERPLQVVGAVNGYCALLAYLLLYGELPGRQQLGHYRQRLVGLRGLPEELKRVLEQLPSTAHPMDVLRTGCSALGCLEPERRFADQQQIADRLLAVFPAIMLYWYHYSHHGQRIDTPTDQSTTAGYFLELLHGKPPPDLHVRAMDVSFILYAEHEFNASTFAARVAASRLSDRQCQAVLDLCHDQDRLEATPVHEFMSLFVPLPV